ncbi:MAG TPA: tryptophan 2,3-dioxygenase family protein, partial [Dongiaceae bacterium]
MSGPPKDDKIIVKRPLEPGMKLDFHDASQAGSRRQTYSDFLKLDQLLSLQAPIQDPPQRDELLFVILHQVAELWLKLLHAELVEGCRSIRADDIKTCNKTLARSKAILEQLISAWKVLLTMTTADYRAFRGGLGQSSGFQSAGYRLVEFVLGNKDAAHLKVHEHNREAYGRLTQALEQPAIYDEVLAYLARQGFPVPAKLLRRDLREPFAGDPEVVEIWVKIYREHDAFWDLYDLAEKLMDVEGLFQRWR